MRFTSPLRLPLQTGSTALKLVLFTFALIPFYWGVWPVLVIYLMSRDARRRRASDIVLSEGGVEVHGGPHEGFSSTWSAIPPGTAVVRLTDELFYKTGDDPAVYQQQFLIDGVELARGGAAEEVASMSAVAALIDETVATTSRSAPVAAPNVPTCATCGAPLVPVDADVTRCPHCGSEAAVPASVRAAVRESAAVRRSTAGVRRALTGGSASATNWLIAATGVSGHVGIPLAVLLVVTHHRSAAGIPILAPMVFIALATSFIAKRVAVRALAFGCAAIAPVDPSHPPCCRRCRAPLPATDDLLARCAYCGVTNVLGIDTGSTSFDDFGDVDEILSRHRRARLVAWAIAGAGVALCVLLLAWSA